MVGLPCLLGVWCLKFAIFAGVWCFMSAISAGVSFYTGAILAGVLFAVRFRWHASFSSWLARRKTGGLFGREGHSHPGVAASMRSSDQPRLRAGA